MTLRLPDATLAKRLLPAVTLLTVWGWNSAAQQTTGAGTPGSAALQPESSSSSPPPVAEPSATSGDTSSHRLFGVLPNFLTVENADQIPPLTAGEKYKLTARGAFDWAEFVWYGALAGIGQLEHSDAGEGQGAAGYGRRYALAFADGTIENFTTKAIFPSILREDPRYFQLGKGGFGHRTWYAVSRIFITRTDSGQLPVQLLRGLRERGSCGYLDLQLPPGRRSAILHNRRCLGRTNGLRRIVESGEGILARHPPQVA